MGRSNAYWTSNLYVAEADEPVPTAPLTDLPPSLAARFRALRDGLLKIEGVGEQVRFMRFEGDKLHIESPPMPHPNVGGKVLRVIVTWERDQ